MRCCLSCEYMRATDIHTCALVPTNLIKLKNPIEERNHVIHSMAQQRFHARIHWI